MHTVAMVLFGMAFSVIGPALVFLAYGMIKTSRGLRCEGLWAGFLAGALVALPMIAWLWPVGWLHLGHDPKLAVRVVHVALIVVPEEALKFCALLFVTRRFVQADDVAGTILTSLSVAVGFALTANALLTITGFSHLVETRGALPSGSAVAPILMWMAVFQVQVAYGLTMGALVAATDEGDDRVRSVISWRLAPALVVPAVMNGAHWFVLGALGLHLPANWGPRLLTFVTAGSVAAAIVICNYVLNRSAQADSTASPGATAPALLGSFLVLFAMLILGIPMLLMLLLPGESMGQSLMQMMAPFCVLPLMFGLDLMWMASGRMGQRR
jgi:RsiW-degrading membrane proteinase PrsW (M82 family)